MFVEVVLQFLFMLSKTARHVGEVSSRAGYFSITNSHKEAYLFTTNLACGAAVP